MKFSYLIAFSLIPFITGWKLPDPLRDLEDLADNVVKGVDDIGQSVIDTVNPVLKAVEDVDKALFGDVNKGIFTVENGIVKGLSEVIGVPVNLKDVNFFLATSKNARNPVEVDYSNPDDVADTKTNIFFITHGWNACRNDSWVVELTEVLLRRYPEAHVVQVDWSKPAGDDYPFSAFDTESVGEIIANLTYNLISNYNVPRGNIVLIGHSLGGQISGWAGRIFKKFTGKKLPLIVGLDPAGPLFCLRPEHRRLNKDDAERVMVIHTDGDVLGFMDPCGTIDFFPNGGKQQPGCAKVNAIDLETYLNPLSCNHVRSHDYLIEAINSSNAFPARRCKTYTDFTMNLNCENVEAYMGYLDEESVGTFYLETSSTKLFSLPLKGSSRSSTTNTPGTNGDIVINVQENDRVNRGGNDIVINVPNRNDIEPKVPNASGDTVIYVGERTTVQTIVVD